MSCLSISPMAGTDRIDSPSSDIIAPAGPPVPSASICLRGLRAFQTVDDDGDTVLVVSDGETTVEFGCGLVGRSAAATRGVMRLVEAVRHYASTIEVSAAVDASIADSRGRA